MFKELNILRLFFESPTKEFNVRELARILKISPATSSSELKKFAKNGILVKRKERILDLYKSNLDNELYKDLKTFYNIRRIKDVGLLDALNNFYLKPAIVLFGSSSFGLDAETSDWDIFVLSENTKEFPDLKKFEDKMKKPIQIFAAKNIRDLKNPHLINNVLNGIKLQGKIEWT